MYVTISSDLTENAQLVFSEQKTTSATTKLKDSNYLYYEGDEVTHLYRIETGVVRLTRVLDDGRRQVIAFGYPGDIVGFPANGLHHADCDALSDSTLQPISRKILEDGLNDPELHNALIRAALGEISAMQDHFMMLGRKSAAEKVASFLASTLARSGTKDRVDLPMSRADIADFLGLTTETVSRCFTALRKAGIIALSGVHTVLVCNQIGLTKRAAGRLD